jgi:hypothetical protein
MEIQSNSAIPFLDVLVIKRQSGVNMCPQQRIKTQEQKKLLEAAFSIRSVQRLHSEDRRRSEFAVSSLCTSTTSEEKVSWVL